MPTNDATIRTCPLYALPSNLEHLTMLGACRLRKGCTAMRTRQVLRDNADKLVCRKPTCGDLEQFLASEHHDGLLSTQDCIQIADWKVTPDVEAVSRDLLMVMNLQQGAASAAGNKRKRYEHQDWHMCTADCHPESDVQVPTRAAARACIAVAR